MKTNWKLLTLGLFVAVAARAESVSFPPGNFENGTGADWTPESTGGAAVSTPNSSGNTVGRIAVTGTGNGSLSTSVQSPFVANSLYVLTVEVSSAALAGASTQLGIAILDGNGNVVKELSQDQILNVLGITLGTVSTFTSDLTGLAGKTNLTAVLQRLLALLNGDPAALGAIQQLVDSLVGADSSTLASLADLLQDVLDGTIADPSTLTSLQISQLLGVAETSSIVSDLQAVLTTISGDDGVIEALQNVIDTLAGNASDTSIVDNLLAALTGQDGLVGTVADILAYALSDPGLLGTLDDTLTQSLLGITDGGDSGFQPVKLIFSTGDAPPSGAIGVRLSSGATLAVGQTVDFDNVTLDRFDLGTGASLVSSAFTSAPPVLTLKGKHVRRFGATRQVIRGTAVANGAQNRIVRVEYKLSGPGAGKNKRYRNAKGTTSFRIIVRPAKNARVLVRAVDALGQVSPIRRVYIYPRG